jgi:hypothetical protein
VTISVITIRLHEKAHRLGDEYYHAMAALIRENRDNRDHDTISAHLDRVERAADAYLHALKVFRKHLGTLRSNHEIAKQVELTDTFIELINKNKGVYDSARVLEDVRHNAEQTNEEGLRNFEAGRSATDRRITPGVSKARA